MQNHVCCSFQLNCVTATKNSIFGEEAEAICFTETTKIDKE
jgi:hypothetical protein